MKKINVKCKLFGFYVLTIIFTLFTNTTSSQIKVTQFNAGLNEANGVDWIMK